MKAGMQQMARFLMVCPEQASDPKSVCLDSRYSRSAETNISSRLDQALVSLDKATWFLRRLFHRNMLLGIIDEKHLPRTMRKRLVRWSCFGHCMVDEKHLPRTMSKVFVAS
jgi:hypothetical protein